ncbi:unnamed protein product [Pieris brassicae]|uniref:Uncharacterized protein n=1 Tax=Pieris brassicae TaxID=7116 RepID=A0A9P0TVT7_PIEBR|nr:unnamed protein product [Pieris brassicae]
MKLGMVRVMCAPCGCSPDKGKSQGGGGSKSKYQITYKPYQIPEYKPHDKKNMDLNRPMSPHVFIYAPTEPAMTSIVERITGLSPKKKVMDPIVTAERNMLGLNLRNGITKQDNKMIDADANGEPLETALGTKQERVITNGERVLHP